MMFLEKLIMFLNGSFKCFSNTVTVCIVFCMKFKTSFTSCFATPLPSAYAPCEYFESSKFVAFSLLWSVRYLPGDDGCGKKRIVSRFFFSEFG